MLTKEQTQELRKLQELTWRKRSGEIDVKMVDHCMKSGKYLQIDNMFVSVCDLKPSITTTLWYDDTRKGPEESWNSFKDLNERHNMPKHWELDFRHTDPLYIRAKYWNDKTAGRLATLEHIPEHHQGNAELLRKVTAEELEQINAAIDEVRQDYAKRLETWWKKYGHKCFNVSGYWVDR